MCDPSGLTMSSYKGFAWQPSLWGRGFGEKVQTGEAALPTGDLVHNRALQSGPALCPVHKPPVMDSMFMSSKVSMLKS